jgi:hypothetical protein
VYVYNGPVWSVAGTTTACKSINCKCHAMQVYLVVQSRREPLLVQIIILDGVISMIMTGYLGLLSAMLMLLIIPFCLIAGLVLTFKKRSLDIALLD